MKDMLTLQSTVKNRAKTQRLKNKKEQEPGRKWSPPTRINLQGSLLRRGQDRFFPLRQNFKSIFLGTVFFGQILLIVPGQLKHILTTNKRVYHHHHHLSFHVARPKVHCILRSVVHTTNVEFFVFCCFG